MRSRLAAAALGLGYVVTGVLAMGAEQLPEGATIARLEANPAQIALDGPYSYAQVLITAELASGDKIDVTRMVQSTVTDDLAEVSPALVVRPKRDGQGQATFAV